MSGHHHAKAQAAEGLTARLRRDRDHRLKAIFPGVIAVRREEGCTTVLWSAEPDGAEQARAERVLVEPVQHAVQSSS